MSALWSPLVHRLKPYVAGEQSNLPNLLKLNTNESPYGPAPEVIEAIKTAASEELRLYPDPNSTRLRIAIAANFGLSPEEVFVGNGSDEVLAFAFCAFFGQQLPILFPDVTYSFYPVYCGLYGIPYRAVPLNANFEVEVDDYAGTCGGIVLPNPNAPTGISLELEQIETLLGKHPNKVVVVDEAYVDFGAQSAVKLLERWPNLLVVQTMSKSRGLAGLRVGYALGSRESVQALMRVKDSFNSYPLDRLAQAGAIASIHADAYFRKTCQLISTTRDELTEQLRSIGFSVLPSKANFIFATHGHEPALRLVARLREHSILVRHFDLPRIDNYLRISIGKPADSDRLVTSLRQLIAPAVHSANA
jgi:histidinol-phosphate aminotransferase